MLVKLLILASFGLLLAWLFRVTAPNAQRLAAMAVVGAALTVGVTPLAGALTKRPADPANPATDGRDVATGTGFGVDESFMQWVEDRVGLSDTFFVRCGGGPCEDGPKQWMVGRLAPRTPVPSGQPADFEVLAGVAPQRDPDTPTTVFYDQARGLGLVDLRGQRR